MIHYNMRYRGTYEYDKFALNILQLHNEYIDFINDLDSDKEIDSFKELYDQVQLLFNNYNNENGLCENIYDTLILFNK